MRPINEILQTWKPGLTQLYQKWTGCLPDLHSNASKPLLFLLEETPSNTSHVYWIRSTPSYNPFLSITAIISVILMTISIFSKIISQLNWQLLQKFPQYSLQCPHRYTLNIMCNISMNYCNMIFIAVSRSLGNIRCWFVSWRTDTKQNVQDVNDMLLEDYSKLKKRSTLGQKKYFTSVSYYLHALYSSYPLRNTKLHWKVKNAVYSMALNWYILTVQSNCATESYPCEMCWTVLGCWWNLLLYTDILNLANMSPTFPNEVSSR